jgi:hypothetical protein
LADTSSESTNNSGLAEAVPLIVGVIGISIPVGLIAAACVTESTALLVLSVIAVFCVGAATLAFVMRLASDEQDPESAAAAHAE